ncbi:cupin domain-containing protein [Methanobacterium aggregans]|uniref:cupin domain-containing protein n=1 Tax=Methanobacterium aggregans TaxID=1615586 RepID=UPI001AEB2580|nr:cupin domain-containing protein [Methanobacterium aggregans]MBP2045681.1 quercetin dioxygenase-like cupin family protein [Methanobacterium aggregans]
MSNHEVSTDKKDYIEVSEGIKRKTLVYGSKTLLTEFVLDGGNNLPMHKHLEEQTGYLVSGNIILKIDGEYYNMKPGDSWSIKGNIEHGAEIKEDSVAIEVFSPVRKDYI